MAENKPKNFEAFAFGEGKQWGTTEYEEIPVIRGFSEIARLFEVCADDTAICGGYVRFMCSPRRNPVKAGDVDLFPKEAKATERLLAFFKAEGFTVKHENKVSVTLVIPKKAPWMYGPVVQIIKPVVEGAVVTLGSIETILDNFDFSITKAALLSPTTALADKDFLNDELKGLLRIKNIHCPISSTLRFMKYARKGYFARPMEIMRLFADWDSRSDEYRARLYEFFIKSNSEDKWTKKEIDELEALLRID